jgi:uncharacterized membrane protein
MISRIFLLSAMLLGIPLVFLLPPFQAPDEPGHFFRAYQVSEGRWVVPAVNGVCGGDLPVSVRAIVQPFVHLIFRPTQKTTRAVIVQTMNIPLEAGEREFVPFDQVIYPPVSYLPQALAIRIGRAVGAPPLWLMYFARLANLLCFCALGCASLAIAPAFRRPLMLILVMPMMLFLAASVSGDVLTDSLAMLLCVMVLRACFDVTVLGRSKMIAIGLVCLALALTKLAYFPLIGLAVLIPSSRFGGGPGKSIFLILLFALTILAELIWITRTAGLHAQVRPEAEPHQQLAIMLRHPWIFPGVVWRTFLRDGWDLFLGLFGLKLGWLDTKVAGPIIPLYPLILLASLWPNSADPSKPPPRFSATTILLCAGGALAAVVLLNYLFWNPVGDRWIDDLQGRYLIPIAPALIMLLGWWMMRIVPWGRWDRTPPRVWNWILLITAAGSGISTMISIYFRYYA